VKAVNACGDPRIARRTRIRAARQVKARFACAETKPVVSELLVMSFLPVKKGPVFKI
jgi:hypothetical protein